MATLDVYNLEKKKVGSVTLDDSVVAREVKEHLFHEVVRAQLASRRAGTHSTKTRSEVHGTAKKPFRQKGTGRARQGDVKSPLQRGGGIVFGPKPRDYSYKPNKKVVKAAVRSALSRRHEEGRLWIVEDFQLEAIKTKVLAGICDNFGWDSALLVDDNNDNLQKSARNLPKVQFLSRDGLNTYDILRYNHVVMSKSAAEQISGALKK